MSQDMLERIREEETQRVIQSIPINNIKRFLNKQVTVAKKSGGEISGKLVAYDEMINLQVEVNSKVEYVSGLQVAYIFMAKNQ